MTNDEIEALEQKVLNDLTIRHNSRDNIASELILKHVVAMKEIDIMQRYHEAKIELDRAKFMREGKTS